MAPVVQLGVQEVHVVEEHFHCDGPEQEQADRQVGVLSRSRLIGRLGVLSRSRLIGRLGVLSKSRLDRQVGGHYHWAVELEEGPHGLRLL